MSRKSKATKKLEKATALIFEAAEELNAITCKMVDNDVLKSIALELGVDHTREPERVLEGLATVARHNGHDLIERLLRVPDQVDTTEKSPTTEFDKGFKRACWWVREEMAREVKEWNEAQR